MKFAYELLRSVRTLATFWDLARIDGGLNLNAIGDFCRTTPRSARWSRDDGSALPTLSAGS